MRRAVLGDARGHGGADPVEFLQFLLRGGVEVDAFGALGGPSARGRWGGALGGDDDVLAVGDDAREVE